MYKTLIFTGPSAIGKTHVANELLKRYPEHFEQAKTYTTRQPRQNEKMADRIFVSEDIFFKMISKVEFLVYGKFGDNWYGFTVDSVKPKNKHLLLNAWPEIIPQFCAYNHVTVVGMQAPKEYQRLLTGRMRNRGDDMDTIKKRMKLISKDQEELVKNTSIINKHGIIFEVTDDNTIQNYIIPWVIKSFGII